MVSIESRGRKLVISRKDSEKKRDFCNTFKNKINFKKKINIFK